MLSRAPCTARMCTTPGALRSGSCVGWMPNGRPTKQPRPTFPRWFPSGCRHRRRTVSGQRIWLGAELSAWYPDHPDLRGGPGSRRTQADPRLTWATAPAEDLAHHVPGAADAVVCDSAIWKTDVPQVFAAVHHPDETSARTGPSLNTLIRQTAARDCPCSTPRSSLSTAQWPRRRRGCRVRSSPDPTGSSRTLSGRTTSTRRTR